MIVVASIRICPQVCHDEVPNSEAFTANSSASTQLKPPAHFAQKVTGACARFFLMSFICTPWATTHRAFQTIV
jgi:hypothetical protein